MTYVTKSYFSFVPRRQFRASRCRPSRCSTFPPRLSSLLAASGIADALVDLSITTALERVTKQRETMRRRSERKEKRAKSEEKRRRSNESKETNKQKREEREREEVSSYFNSLWMGCEDVRESRRRGKHRAR